jgi:hypothetical protein
MRPGHQRKLTLLYIAGSGRSGSTILDRVLGAMDSTGSYNELYRVFEDGFGRKSKCSCGMQFDECRFWLPVMARVLGPDVRVEDCIADSRRFDRSRMFFSIYHDLMSGKSRRRLVRYRSLLEQLLHAMAEEAGIDTIIDSSKLPARALVLAGIPSIDVRVIHLLREPRAVANAWLKERYDPGRGSSMNRYGALRTMAFWAGRQTMSERLGNRTARLPIRYEDFASRPRQILAEIARFVPGWEARSLPVSEEGDVHLGPLHSLSGNPDRFRTGSTRIELDEAWRTSSYLPTLDRAASLVRPVSRRYGY